MLSNSREYADYNYDGIGTLKNGMAGIFEYLLNQEEVIVFIRDIVELSTNTAIIQKYLPTEKDRSGNNIICRADNLMKMHLNRFFTKGVLDIFMNDHNGNRIINTSKFGISTFDFICIK